MQKGYIYRPPLLGMSANIARSVVTGQYIVHDTAIVDAGQSLDVDGRRLQCRKWRAGLIVAKRPARKASILNVDHKRFAK